MNQNNTKLFTQSESKTFTLGDKKLHLHFLTVVGSRLHKLTLDNSDVDLKGVFVWDETVEFGLETPLETLSHKNTDKDEWADLLVQLKKELNLEFELDDDLDLFEARKFMVTALKNDFNMFDLLFSNEVLFVTNEFDKVLENRDSFTNMKLAKSRFSGMATSSLKRAKTLSLKGVREEKEQRDFNKNMAKSLQFLFSLNNLFLNRKFNTVLEDEQRLEVLDVKSGKKNFLEVQKRFDELDETMNNTFNENKEALEKLVFDRTKVNELLVSLKMNR